MPNPNQVDEVEAALNNIEGLLSPISTSFREKTSEGTATQKDFDQCMQDLKELAQDITREESVITKLLTQNQQELTKKIQDLGFKDETEMHAMLKTFRAEKKATTKEFNEELERAVIRKHLNLPNENDMENVTQKAIGASMRHRNMQEQIRSLDSLFENQTRLETLSERIKEAKVQCASAIDTAENNFEFAKDQQRRPSSPRHGG